MKYLLVPFLALSIGSAAIANTDSAAAAPGSYPACSKRVTDECAERAAKPTRHTPAKSMKTAQHRHHRAVKKTN